MKQKTSNFCFYVFRRELRSKIMSRKTFDKITSILGLMIALFLFLAGGLVQWGYTFADHAVSAQLSAQKIDFPALTHNAKESADVTAFFAAHGGKVLTTGKEAQMYADHYLGYHLSLMPTYAAASGKNMAAQAALKATPKDPAVQAAAVAAAGTVETVFKGTSLRGMLLNAYAFWQLGQIAMYSAIAAFAGGLLFLVLALMGFAHLRRVNAEEAI
jgi:hypothetical protein